MDQHPNYWKSDIKLTSITQSEGQVLPAGP